MLGSFKTIDCGKRTLFISLFILVSRKGNGDRINPGYVTGSNNQLLSDGIYNYENDAEKNRTKRTEIANSEVTQYRNRLIQVVVVDANGVVQNSADYTYNVFDCWISKTVDSDGEVSAIALVE